VLSRLKPQHLEDHPLPGPAGRGAILVRFGEGDDALIVVMMHLALGAKTRARQLAYIRELIGGYRHQILMGDMNTHATDLLEHSPLRDLGLIAPRSRPPSRAGDHSAASITSCSARASPWNGSRCWHNRFPITCPSLSRSDCLMP
jgi:endonuclease/exonuclease/phosphatase family metal-dependent hydrolase